MKPVPASAPEDEGEPLFDYALIAQYVRFAFGALRAHKLLGAVTFLLVMAVAALSLKVLPKTWHAEARLLAQRNPVLPALGNPARAVPADADAPTRAAVETVMRRDSLISLIKQTDLIAQWDARSAPLVRAIDAIVTVLSRDPTPEERLDDFVEMLEKHLKVSTDEGSVTIAIDWPDAEIAYRLVETAQQDFLETRHVAELSAITEAIGILDEHAKRAEEGISELIDDLRKTREQQDLAQRDRAHGAQPRASPSGSISSSFARTRPRPHTAEIAQLQLTLAGKRRAIEDLEDFRRRRIDELQQRLTELRVSYASAHPLVRGTEESLAALSSSDSPQLSLLKREERDLRAHLAQLTSDPQARPQEVTEVEDRGPMLVPSRAGPGLGLELRLSDERDPSLEYGDSQLRIAVDKYQALLDRLESARIELDTARAAFKYRYIVVKPAKIPKKATKPHRLKVMLAGLMAGGLLALGASVARDLRRPRLRERWQIERWLGLKVLAERLDPQSCASPGADLAEVWLHRPISADRRLMTLVPLHPASGASELGCALCATAKLMTGESVELVDARNLRDEQLAAMVAHLKAKTASGATAIALAQPPAQSPSAVGLALASDAVLVTVSYGIALEDARGALHLLSPSSVIGCVVVPPR